MESRTYISRERVAMVAIIEDWKKSGCKIRALAKIDTLFTQQPVIQRDALEQANALYVTRKAPFPLE